MSHINAEDRTPGTAINNDLLLVEMFGQKLGNFDAIIHHALDSHGRLDRRAALSVGSASATLVPLDKREVFLPSRVHGIGEWTQGVPWSTVQEEHGRTVAIITFDRDPLVDASDPDKHFFLNPLWRVGR